MIKQYVMAGMVLENELCLDFDLVLVNSEGKYLQTLKKLQLTYLPGQVSIEMLFINI